MDLSKAVAGTAVLLIVILAAGHGLAQKTAPEPAAVKPHEDAVKPVNEQKRPAGRSGTTARSAG
jgi:hypothetical protein